MTGSYQIRALVVDDSDFFAEMTADTLSEKHGIDATAVNNPESALERIRAESFDCVVSDYEMPEMDGLELLRSIRQFEPTLPFILLTGRGDEETASEAIAAGVADYLLKLEVVEDKQYGRLANRIENVVSQNRTRKKFESLVENSPDGIAQLDTDGRLLSVNPAMADQLRGERTELTDRQLTAVMDTETATARIEATREAVETGDPVHTEDTVAGRYYSNQFVPVDGHRGTDWVQLVSRDITERIEREQELQRQNERLDQFASVVSHDLRNPLNVANSALDLLSEPDDETEAEYHAKIDRSLDRMAAIIDDVLALARNGQTVDEPSVVSLSTIATDAWDYVETVESELIVTDDFTFRADPGRLRDMLANAFRNAVEHNDSPVTVEVGTLTDGTGFYVADDGDGIEDGVDDIFQMGNSASEAGTGMGLAIVSEIATAHGWTVEATEGDTGGARFEVTGVDPV
ncbi:ATP-binding response regulator [Haloarcula halophila]|uniref:ATP-binding response regulator n=1 Tax=Haloarcula TaxID=2237 RepID=UPI0023E3B9D4|nr:response regulator [Halomicroarcula sp. DFY41]